MVMSVVLHRYDEGALRGLRTLTNKVVSEGRTHALPRRRMYDHRRHKANNRLSILLSSSTGACQFVDDEIERKTQQMDEEWVGCSGPLVGDEKHEGRIDTWGGMVKMSLAYRDN